MVAVRLEKYGGHGYSYITVPCMRPRGLSEGAIQALLFTNLRDASTSAEPLSG